MAHAIKHLLAYYDFRYQKRFGVKAPIVGAKDAALAKRLLGTYTQAQLEGWVDRFFQSDDQFIQQSGYTFGVFSSCIGKVIAAERQTVTVSAKMARSLKAIYGETS